MKILSLMALCTFVLCVSCEKDDDTPVNPKDQLPPATQTGENTFGCLLDGEAFLPGPGPLTLDCVYQFVNGDYYFALQANKRDEQNNSKLIGCSTEKLEIEEGQIYKLMEGVEGNAYGSYFFNLERFRTSSLNSGEMYISKLDMEKNIVSGTFWYDVEDQDGNIHQVRDGRFDMTFSK
ncbi:hypothetical protein [Seonamhaeicola sp.]|uniref:hypothetical protein n=1 Tax=Seonamhaeicola sp. TaxID=1912245 RepID=UPI002615CE00|nr:hypothetical protein [Seonamhaeicola sp.]